MKINKYWEVKLAAERVGELLLYGPISDTQFWGDEVTPKQIDTDLKALGEIDTLNVHINSGGGSVFAAQAIYSIIKRHGAQTKNAYIDGLAASAATLIPYACEKVYAYSNAMMMIHKPAGGAYGSSDLLRQRADLLDKVEDMIVDAYEDKCKKPKDDIKAMLAAETWMTAEEAKELGFVDEIENEVKVAASIDGDFLICGEVKVDLKVFKDATKIKEMYREVTPQPVAIVAPPPVSEALAEQTKDRRKLMDKIYKTYEEEK